MPERGRWTFGSAGAGLSRVLFVHPPLDRLRGLLDSTFPIHAGYLAAALQADGLTVRILNAELPERGERLSAASERGRIDGWDRYLQALNNRQHRAWQQIEHVLRDFKPGMVILWVETSRFGAAMAISRITREIAPRATIAWCGPHPTAVPAVALDPSIDYALLGEAEKTLVALVRAIRHREQAAAIEGLALKQDGRMVRTGPRELIREVDTILAPGRHLDPAEHSYPPEALTALYSARGVPVKCHLSAEHIIWGRGLRARSGYALTEELHRLLKRYPSDTVTFLDGSFTANARRTVDLCQALANDQLPALWSCTTRANLLDERLLEAMTKAGCYLVNIEAVTGSSRMMKLLELGTTPDQIERAGMLCRSFGLAWSARFYAGFPQETEEDLTQTRDLVASVPADMVDLRVITPAPGTELFAEALKMGVILTPVDWSVFSQYNPKTNFVKSVSRDRFDELVDEMLDIVEKHNGAWRNRLSRTRAHLRLYRRNPLRLVKKTVQKLRGG